MPRCRASETPEGWLVKQGLKVNLNECQGANQAMFDNFWKWMPGESVGPFHFGSDADTVVHRFGLRKLEPDCPGADWETYEIPGYDSRLSAEEGKIISINCWDSLYYHDLDLLGLDIDQVRSIFGVEDRLDPLGDTGMSAVYYGSLGLTLWLEGWMVKSASCTEPMDVSEFAPQD